MKLCLSLTHLPVYSRLLLILQLLFLCHDVTGQYRRQRRQRSNDEAPGPNMCRIQHVLGTRQKFFTHCVAKHLKMICERPTYQRWECCSGYQRKRGEQGCPIEKPLDTIMETARDLSMDQFVAHAEAAGISSDLSRYGPYTVFVPSNEAIKQMSGNTRNMLNPADESLSLLNYHVAPGKLNLSLFTDRNQEFITLHNRDKIRVNKYAYGVATVNCARIVRPDEMATNGIVHVIDKVISPVDVQSSLADRVMEDNRFSQFQLALLVSDMTKKLRSKTHSYTLLAPTNQAFAKLPSDVLDRILTDADTAEKVIKRHIIRGVFCADAIVVAVGLKTTDDARLLFRCKRDGLWINDAKVVASDIMASNGVLHGIDRVLLPDCVKSSTELLHDMHLDRFLDLAKQAGLNDSLEQDNITLFTPTDEAFRNLPSGYLAALQKEPLKMGKLLKYHMIRGRIPEGQLVGDTSLDSLADVGVKIKVKVTRKGVTVDKSSVEEHPRECKNAMIHKVDKVMVPPENSLMDEMLDDPQLSEFAAMLEKTGVSNLLLPDGSYTVVAPTNKAFAHLLERQFKVIRNDPVRLKKFIQRHVLYRMVLKCSVPERGVYTVVSMQGDETDFGYDSRKRLYVGKHSRVLGDDTLTSNGVLYKVDHVLPCSCERAMLTKHKRYITSHSYRRRYR